MTRVRWRLVVAGLLLLLVGLSVGIGAAAPADAQERNETATASSTSEEPGETNVTARVDSAIVVEQYSYDPDAAEGDWGVMSVALHNRGDSTRTVTLTEAIGSSAASGRFGIQRVDVAPGETVTAKVDVRVFSGTAAVMVTTEESIQQGHGSYLPVDRGGGGGWFDGGATWADVRAGVGFTLIGALGVVLLAAWQHVAARHEDVDEVGLDA